MLPSKFLDVREASEHIQIRHELTQRCIEFSKTVPASPSVLLQERKFLLSWQAAYARIDQKLEYLHLGAHTKPAHKMIRLQMALVKDLENAYLLQRASGYLISKKMYQEQRDFLLPLFDKTMEEAAPFFSFLTETLNVYFELQSLVEQYIFFTDQERRDAVLSWKLMEKYRKIKQIELMMERAEELYHKLDARVGRLMTPTPLFLFILKERRIQLMRAKLRLAWVTCFLKVGDENESKRVLDALEPELIRWIRQFFQKNTDRESVLGRIYWKAIEHDLFALIAKRGWVLNPLLKPIAGEIRKWHQAFEKKVMDSPTNFEGDESCLLRNGFLKFEIQIEGFYRTLREGTRQEVEDHLKGLQQSFDFLLEQERNGTEPHRQHYGHRLALVLAVFQASKDAKPQRGTLAAQALQQFKATTSQASFLVHSPPALFAYWTFVSLYFLLIGADPEVFAYAQAERDRFLPSALSISTSSPSILTFSPVARAQDYQKQLYKNLKQEIESLHLVGRLTEALFQDHEESFRDLFARFSKDGAGVHFQFFRYAFTVMGHTRGWIEENDELLSLSRKLEHYLDQYFRDMFQTLRYFQAIKEGSYQQALRWLWTYVKAEKKTLVSVANFSEELEWVAQQAISEGQLEPWSPLVKEIEQVLGQSVDLDWKEWFERRANYTEEMVPSTEGNSRGRRPKEALSEPDPSASAQPQSVPSAEPEWYYPSFAEREPKSALLIARIYASQPHLTRTEVRGLFDKLALFFGEEPLKPRYKGSHLKVCYPLWLQRSMDGRVFCVLNEDTLRPYHVQQLRRGLRAVGFSPEGP